tara:strand:+ start:150 stop:1208 length:1059 start_codon:yes stop_codon:yes gene_type:complete
MQSIVIAQDYDIYVSDAGNFTTGFKIIKYDSSGSNPSTFINTNLPWPQDMIFFEDSGFVLVSTIGNGRISRFDSNTGAFLSHFATGIGDPTRMKIRNDTLYVLQWAGNNRILRYLLDGTYIGNFTTAGVGSSIGLDWDHHGNLYVSSYYGDYVQKFGPSGADSGRFINSNLAGPTNIWFDKNGDLLVSDYDGTAVKRFDSTGSFKSNFITGLSKCEGVAFLPNGDILIGNGFSSSVKQYDSLGNYKRDIIPSGRGGLQNPNAIVIRPKRLSSGLSAEKVDQAPTIRPTVGEVFDILGPQQIDQISLISMDGRISQLSINNSYIDLSNRRSGIYVLRLETAKGVYDQRILVSH